MFTFNIPYKKDEKIGKEGIMSGMIMYPQSMRKKASEMLRKLDSMDEKIEKFFKRYEEAQSPLELSGMAWSSVKSYIEDIPDVHKLNKDQMENSIRKYRRYIEIEENRKNPNEDRIMRYEELIAEFEEKIQHMEDFAVAISGIFSEANAMQATLTGADNVLNSVKLTRTGTAIHYTSLSESEEMQAITVVANIYIIMSGGVSREKIRELEGMGFDKSSISKVFAASRDGGEKDMIIHFIKGDYKKAFTTANKDNGLVDSTAVFITEYLYRLGKKKNTDEEIQKVINAILESEDGINVKRAIACFTSLQFAAETLLEVDYIAAMRGARFMTGEEYGEIVNRNNRFKAVAILYGSTADIGEIKLVLAGEYNLNTARTMEMWRYEKVYKNGELVDLKLGDLIKDENIMNKNQMEEIRKKLEEEIEKAKGNKAEVERTQKVLDVWDGNIDDIPIEELDKHLTSINKVCNDHLKLYDNSKKIDFRRIISN